VIAPGVWLAIDANICQNRQNSAVVDGAGGSDGFGGFVTPSSPEDQQSLDEGMLDNGGTGQMPTVVPA
jgi:hypothetical protein